MTSISDTLKNSIKEALEKIDEKNLNWYVVQVYNNSELAVKEQILQMKEDFKLNNINYILAPYEEVISITKVQKKKNTLKKALFPGYVFMALNEPLTNELKMKLKVIPKLSQVIDVKLTSTDIKKIKSNIENAFSSQTKKYKVDFDKNDKVVVTSGPFMSFRGEVVSTNPNNYNALVNLNILGREVPTTIHFDELDIGD